MKQKIEIDKVSAIDFYNIYQNINVVAKKLNCDRTTLWRRLSSWGVKIKKNKHEGFDQYYFHNIDTEAKAYFFGFLLADGNNYSKQYRITLSLAEADKKILEDFKNEIKTTSEIKTNKSYKETHQDKKYLQINSKIMSNKLSEIGCVDRKSNILKFPKNIIPDNLMNHFIRGVFDGDGSISTSKHKTKNWKYHVFNITGNSEFLVDLQKILVKECNLNQTKLNKPKRYKNGTAMLVYGGAGNILKIRQWLYKDSKFFLERKKNKFFSIETKKNNKHI